MSRYRKFITAVVGALVASIPLLWDRVVDQAEAVTLLTVWATALGVYEIPNDTPVGVPADPDMSERG
jgi:hypothetical protein